MNLNNKSILVVQIGKLGDAILATPLIHEINRIYPDCKISVICNLYNSIIFKNIDFIINIYIYEKNLTGLYRLFRDLSGIKFCYLIDTKPEYSRTAIILSKIIRHDKSIGYNKLKAKYDIPLNNLVTGSHAILINCAPLRYFVDSYIPALNIPEIPVPLENRSRIESYLKKNNIEEYILINISAGISSRKWNPDIVKHIINYCIQYYHVIIISHNDDYIKKYLNCDSFYNKINFFSGTFLESCELVRRSRLIITPDTSFVHAASAFNKPILSLFNNVKWNLERFYPISDIKEVIVSETEKIDDIKLEEIIGKIEIVLKQI